MNLSPPAPVDSARTAAIDHYLVDGGKARIVAGALVTAADVRENMVFLDMLWRACFRWKLRPYSATGDTTYGTVEIIRALEDAGIRAYVPINLCC